jgi:hypothetical protein
MGKPDSLARLDSAHRSAVGAAGLPHVHDKAQRAAIILQSADGARARHLAEVFGRSKPAIWLWRGGEVWADP